MALPERKEASPAELYATSARKSRRSFSFVDNYHQRREEAKTERIVREADNFRGTLRKLLRNMRAQY